MSNTETLNKINSLILYLSAHPHCTEHSECADRLEDLVEIKISLKIKIHNNEIKNNIKSNKA